MTSKYMARRGGGPSKPEMKDFQTFRNPIPDPSVRIPSRAKPSQMRLESD